MTVFAEQASQVASRDRTGHTDHLLDVACWEAAQILRIGRRRGDQHAFVEANLVLAKAQRRASRILPPQVVAS